MKKHYALETEFGTVFVSKKEFEDIKARVNGGYGPDFTFAPDGEKWYWQERSEDGLTVGTARKPLVEQKEPRSKFEVELMRLLAAGKPGEALKHVDRWKAAGFNY